MNRYRFWHPVHETYSQPFAFCPEHPPKTRVAEGNVIEEPFYYDDLGETCGACEWKAMGKGKKPERGEIDIHDAVRLAGEVIKDAEYNVQNNLKNYWEDSIDFLNNAKPDNIFYDVIDMKPGMKFSKPVKRIKRNFRAVKEITLGGKTLTRKKWAKKLGITEQCFDRRHFSHREDPVAYPVEKVLTKGSLHTKKGKSYTYKGKTLTSSEWADKIGILRASFIGRQKRWRDGEITLDDVYKVGNRNFGKRKK